MRIASITRQSGLLATALLLFVAIVEHLRLMLLPSYAAECAACIPGASWGKSAVSTACLLATGIIIGRFAMRSGIFNNFCTLPIPLFGIAAVGIFITPETLPASAAAMCIAAAVSMFIRTLSHPDEKNPVFFGSMLLGTAPLLYPPCVVMLALLPFAALVSFQSWRKIVIAAVGALLPFAALSYCVWYAGGRVSEPAEGIARWFVPDVHAPSLHADGFPILATAMTAILLALAVAGIILKRSDCKTTLTVKTDRSIQILSATLVLALAAFAVPRCSVALMPVAAVPVSVLAAAALDRIKPEPSTLIYWLLLLLLAAHLFLK